MQGNDAFERSQEKRYNKMYYVANNQKIADKKKADYREGLEKSHADSVARSHESYKRTWRRVAMTVLHRAVRVT